MEAKEVTSLVSEYVAQYFGQPNRWIARLIVQEHPEIWGSGEKAIHTVRNRVMHKNKPGAPPKQVSIVAETPIDILAERVRKAILNTPQTVEQLADRFNVAPKTIRKTTEALEHEKYNLMETDEGIQISTTIKQGASVRLNPSMWEGDIIRIGAVADNHLCNVHSREDVLNLLYDRFEKENIPLVYNCGNWIDGEHRFNKNELTVHGCTGQVKYFVEHYPERKGVETRFIAGDDHEGWFVQREGIDVGAYAEMMAHDYGRTDLVYLGYAEADVLLTPDAPDKQWMRVLHAGGGSAYALSYSSQKIAEAVQGGEKPKIMLIGHYHKFDYAYPREIHMVQVGCTCDQSLFMRKNKIQAMVGGCIIEMTKNCDGMIQRVRIEWIPFYDKQFYQGRDKYLMTK
jgi:hypothetical protein